MDMLFEITHTYKMIPPADYRPFEWELAKARNSLKLHSFGYSYDVIPKKMLKRDKSDANLIEALCCFEKYSNEKGRPLSPDWSDPFDFFREVLERDIHIAKDQALNRENIFPRNVNFIGL